MAEIQAHLNTSPIYGDNGEPWGYFYDTEEEEQLVLDARDTRRRREMLESFHECVQWAEEVSS